MKSKPFLSRFLYQILEQNWIDINNLFTDISDIFDNNPKKKLPWLLVHTRTRLGWAWSGLETNNFSLQERKTSQKFLSRCHCFSRTNETTRRSIKMITIILFVVVRWIFDYSDLFKPILWLRLLILHKMVGEKKWRWGMATEVKGGKWWKGRPFLFFVEILFLFYYYFMKRAIWCALPSSSEQPFKLYHLPWRDRTVKHNLFWSLIQPKRRFLLPSFYFLVLPVCLL